MPDIFQHPVEKINNINDKTDDVKMIFSTNQNQNMLILVKKQQYHFFVFLAQTLKKPTQMFIQATQKPKKIT